MLFVVFVFLGRQEGHRKSAKRAGAIKGQFKTADSPQSLIRVPPSAFRSGNPNKSGYFSSFWGFDIGVFLESDLF